ncbi:NAD(P)-binding protein, partial [Aureobasidium melanogenum]
MAEITINDADLQAVKGKVVLMTGGSSGIGLATTTLLLGLGAKVINGDMNPPPSQLDSESADSYEYVRTNVTIWPELVTLFKAALDLHGHIDHVFANAGMRPVANYLALEEDTNGDPTEPNHMTLDVNLKAVVNTACLGLHYMQKHPAPKNSVQSITLTGSTSSIYRFRAADYGLSKHGVLGLLRGLAPVTYPDLPIRVNVLCPSWTVTGLTDESNYRGVKVNLQSAEPVARAAVLLMADESRHGQMVLSAANKYREIEEAVLLKAMTPEIRGQELTEDEICAAVAANIFGQAQ